MHYILINSFNNLEEQIKKEFHIENKNEVDLIRNRLSLVLRKITDFKLDSPKVTEVRTEGDTILKYKIDNAFKLSIDFFYYWLVGVVPFTGTGTLYLKVKSGNYTLKVNNKEIEPQFEAEYDSDLKNITNSLAIKFGLKDSIKGNISPVDKYFNDIIAKCYKTEIKKYFEDIYKNTVNNILFPHLNYTFNRSIDKIQIKPLPEPALEVHYNSKIEASTNLMTDTEKCHLRDITFEIKELANIMRKGFEAIKGISITEQNIAPHSLFHLDSRSLSRLYSDFSYESEKNNAIITFNSASNDLKGNFLDKEKLFEFEGANLSMVITLDNEQKTQVANASIELKGKFQAIFYDQPEPNTKSNKTFMKLKAMEMDFNVKEMKGLYDKQHTIFNEKGFKSFIEVMVKYYFTTFAGDKALGTGLLIATNLPMDERTLNCSSGNGTCIISLYDKKDNPSFKC